VHVLLDDEHRRALLGDAGQGLVQLADHDRGQAQGDLVELQQAGVGHQRAADGHGLLLPAREVRGRAAPPLRHEREQLADGGQVPRAGAP